VEAAFFDLDQTILSRSSSLVFSRPLYRAGMVSRGQLLLGAYAQLVWALNDHDGGRPALHEFTDDGIARNLARYEQTAGGLRIGQQDEFILIAARVDVGTHPLQVAPRPAG
jgi:hypothetical protein